MNSNLPKGHKSDTKYNWKKIGLVWTSEEEFEEIYLRVISSTNCELCKKPYKSNKGRQMDHAHYIDNKWGWFRNVVCSSCNQLRSDNKIRSDNISGYIGIYKQNEKKCKQGFRWVFRAMVGGKYKVTKKSVDLEYLKKFAEKWKIDNDYYT